jgi:hypothetical protein
MIETSGIYPEPVPMPEWLAAKFDALPALERSLFAGPVTSEDARRNIKSLCSILRREHWTKEQAIELAKSFPFGFGKLNGQSAPTISEIWPTLTPWDQVFIATTESWSLADLRPRAWVAPPYLMKGEINLVHGLGGAGKSQVVISWCVALALGRQYGRLKPTRRHRVLLFGLEQSRDEQEKRLSAALIYFEASERDLENFLFRVYQVPERTELDKAGNPVIVTNTETMFELNEWGSVDTTVTWEAFQGAVAYYQPDIVVVDPFVAINAVPENLAHLMRRVFTLFKLHARRELYAYCLILVHHDTKGGDNSDDGDALRVRGSTDIVNSVTMEEAVRTLDKIQAQKWEIPEDRRGWYFRLGSVASKRNLTAPEEGEWFERISEKLEIGRKSVVEEVVRCIPWTPPNQANGKDAGNGAGPRDISDATFVGIINELRRGRGGRLFLRNRAPTGDPQQWAGAVIRAHTGFDQKQAKRIIEEWLDQGILLVEAIKRGAAANDWHTIDGLKVNEVIVPQMPQFRNQGWQK